MNEAGKPMHKSDGTAIWFEEAAEQIGVDTMRWMYLAQNPSLDLRFGTRHPDQPVTLETVKGPTNLTIDGVATHRVTSTPADETRRMVMIPLWNSYAFFVNYARLDEFDPTAPQVPDANRPEIDLWLLSNENLAHVQLSDIADVPREMAADADRILPGEGTSPPDDLVARLREIGYEGAVAVELHNPALWRVPPRQFGEIAMTSLRKVLGQAAM